jgi:hypothetical protein
MDTMTEGWSDVTDPEFWLVSDACSCNMKSYVPYIHYAKYY